jgi:transcription-repair coupling factor (superfamily II helicase)
MAGKQVAVMVPPRLCMQHFSTFKKRSPISVTIDRCSPLPLVSEIARTKAPAEGRIGHRHPERKRFGDGRRHHNLGFCVREDQRFGCVKGRLKNWHPGDVLTLWPRHSATLNVALGHPRLLIISTRRNGSHRAM